MLSWDPSFLLLSVSYTSAESKFFYRHLGEYLEEEVTFCLKSSAFFLYFDKIRTLFRKTKSVMLNFAEIPLYCAMVSVIMASSKIAERSGACEEKMDMRSAGGGDADHHAPRHGDPDDGCKL
jgi:hypothetical protein